MKALMVVLMKKIILGAAAGLLFFAWQTVPGFAAGAKNSCLTCHTNDKMMKMLYKPPKIAGGQAEG
jgi:cytochrome c553